MGGGIVTAVGGTTENGTVIAGRFWGGGILTPNAGAGVELEPLLFWLVDVFCRAMLASASMMLGIAAGGMVAWPPDPPEASKPTGGVPGGVVDISSRRS